VRIRAPPLHAFVVPSVLGMCLSECNYCCSSVFGCSDVYQVRTAVSRGGSERKPVYATRSYLNKDAQKPKKEEDKTVVKSQTVAVIKTPSLVKQQISFARAASGGAEPDSMDRSEGVCDSSMVSNDDVLNSSIISGADGEDDIIEEKFETDEAGDTFKVISTRTRSGSFSRLAKKPRIEGRENISAITPGL
jgi:hypothetical protein